MYRITFALGDLGGGGSPPPAGVVLRGVGPSYGRSSADRIGTLLATLVRADEMYLRAHPEVPPLASSGVSFAEEPQGYQKSGEENWQDVPTCLGLRRAGNRDLACWLAAELRLRHGVEAAPVVVSERTLTGMLRYRVVVRLPDGRVVDPSSGRGARDVPKNHRIAFVLDLFNGPQERLLSNETLQLLLDALCEEDERFLLMHPSAPMLYRSGVVYQEEPPGQEDWQDVPTTVRMGFGDCEDLACWRAAELRVRSGIDARPTFTSQVKPDGAYLYHILVRLPDGRIEDPSRNLGMR
jgi:hypothetical protein